MFSWEIILLSDKIILEKIPAPFISGWKTRNFGAKTHFDRTEKLRSIELLNPLLPLASGARADTRLSDSVAYKWDLSPVIWPQYSRQLSGTFVILWKNAHSTASLLGHIPKLELELRKDCRCPTHSGVGWQRLGTSLKRHCCHWCHNIPNQSNALKPSSL